MGKKRNLLIILVTSMFVFFAFGSSDEEDSPTVTKSSESDDSEKSGEEGSDDDGAEEVEAAEIGDEVDMGDSKWTVVSAEDLGKELDSGNDFIEPKTTEGKYIKVVVKVENTSNEEVRISETPSIRDSQGRNFKQIDGQSMYLPDGATTMIFEAIPAGMSKEFTGIYEIAPNAEELEFMVRDFEIFDTATFPVDLGI